jgi:tRNA-specific 2-thiouridylase
VQHKGRTLLARGADPDKDQSYMLAGLEPDFLEHVRFPLGAQTKAETRAEAARAGLAAARGPEARGVLSAATLPRVSSGSRRRAR